MCPSSWNRAPAILSLGIFINNLKQIKVMKTVDKIITLAVTGIALGVTLAFGIALAWTLSIIFGH